MSQPMIPTKAALERLGNAANNALFELHRYMDKCEIERWREVYGARCRVNEVVFNETERIRREADALAEREGKANGVREVLG